MILLCLAVLGGCGLLIVCYLAYIRLTTPKPQRFSKVKFLYDESGERDEEADPTKSGGLFGGLFGGDGGEARMDGRDGRMENQMGIAITVEKLKQRT